jgi:succinyl-diaminopimelate desuccinylase
MKSSILNYAIELIKIPSQADINNNTNILNFIYKWTKENKIDCKYLYNQNNEKSAILIEIKGSNSENHYCFNACSDTAPIGELSKWKFPPTNSIIDNDYLYGRGSADSKIAISIFSHIAKKLTKYNNLNGQVDFLFDADEHTGKFSGVKSYLKYLNGKKINGVFIGYPGNDNIVIGARGFYRANITLYGNMAHSGSSKTNNINSIVKAAQLIDKLNKIKFDEEADPYFKFGPKITVTKINGGEGFSVIPSKCTVSIDIRLTPGFNIDIAKSTLKNIIYDIDNSYSVYYKSTIEECSQVLPYRIDENTKFVTTLLDNAKNHFKKSISTVVCGPSNIGNLLAENKIDATCGFGVSYDNIHSIDERVYIPSIENVYTVYLDTILQLIGIKKD